MDKAPVITPVKVKEYEVKQSKYHQCGKLPVRSVILGPSGSGKGILLQNMILDIYKNCFERIYIFSPSIHVDHTWEPVKEYIKKTMPSKDDEPECYYDHYDPESLEKIIDTQKKIIEFQKQKKETKRLFQILIIIDDFADDASFSRQSKLLHALFTRGRHSQISTIVATQKFTALHPIIRVNASELFVFRLRNYSDLQTFLDEVSALVDKKALLEMYNLATEQPFSFLYVRLTEKHKDKMFMIKFNQYLVVL